MTVREWAEYWQEQYDAAAVRRTTCEVHRYVLENHIAPCLGEWELTQLTSDTAGEFLLDAGPMGTAETAGRLSEVTMGHG